MKITRLDHLVITTKDISKSLYFYTNILGMELDENLFNEKKRYAVKFGNSKINIHVRAGEFQPAAKNPTIGSGDLCFIVDGDINNIKKEVESKGITIEEGVVKRTGALGPIDSIYLRDPDENLIEISTYNIDVAIKD
ncbi:hypothetical protein CYY_000801 [Polysphondylium violaceum]|uniref:VOC domain-containing protein n=1 Tax=Polysphondylium violaceum TaxID=133409 RepID=A0A8J4V595_9MYCE|nr:hypothetical protein CYY_000801 [Polysphondylium violaceum]